MYGVSRLDISEDVALVSFNNIPLDLALLSDIFTEFAKHEIVLDMISQTTPVSGHVSLSFSCFDRDMVKVLELAGALRKKYPRIRPMVSSGNCKLQLFGEEMRTAHGVFAKALASLSGAGVELQQVTTSEVDISLLIGTAHMQQAVQALCEAFAL